MHYPRNEISGLYLIIDASLCLGRSHEEVAEAGIEGGAGVIQLRGKGLCARDAYPVAARLRELTSAAGVTFIINDSVELAMAVKADGLHLGQDDFPPGVARRLLGEGIIIGVSTHSPDEVLGAVRDGADYIGFGPVFATATKDAGPPKGPDALREIRGLVDIPVVAIGGITAGNARSVIEAGADAVAVIGAVCGADDMAGAAREIAGIFSGRR